MATAGSRMPKRGVPEGLWMRCPQCKATIFRKEAESRFNVCPECEYHFYVPAQARIAQLLDEDSFEEWFADLSPCDPLGFKDRIIYAERLTAEQAKTGMRDAAVVGKGFAVLQTGKVQVSGFLAWLTWAVVHLQFLATSSLRLSVFLQWVWTYVTGQRGDRLIVNRRGAEYAKAAVDATIKPAFAGR